MATRAAICAGMVLFSPALALACPVCFGGTDGAMLQGSNMGILALLLVTLAVLGAFGTFFMTLARRASRSAAALTDHASGVAGGQAGNEVGR